jgi:hypothetical protein
MRVLFVCLFVAGNALIVPDCSIVDEFVQNVAKEPEAIFRPMTLGRPAEMLRNRWYESNVC